MNQEIDGKHIKRTAVITEYLIKPTIVVINTSLENINESNTTHGKRFIILFSVMKNSSIIQTETNDLVCGNDLFFQQSSHVSTV